MPGERAVPAEPVLENFRPQGSPVFRGERGERLSQIPRRQQAEFTAKPTGGPTVIGNCDDGGDLRGDPA
jgi:hypothetical protein